MSNELFDDIHAFLGRFVSYPSEEDHVAHTLWIAHAHLMDEWYTTPRIAFLSPEPESGKTRALEITNLLVPNSILAFGASPAALVRKMSDPQGLPTILYDEIDTVFGFKAKGDNEDLRALINAGYKRGNHALKCTRGDDIKVESFPAYGAFAMAGIGNLPDTILGRSIVIRMRRRKPDEHVEPFRDRDHDPEGKALRERLAAWATTQKGTMGLARPVMPDGVVDRSAEVWEPLLAVADAVGGDWPARARVSAVTAVTASQEDKGISLGIRLLSDLHAIFEGVDRLSTTTIIYNIINNIDSSIWGTIKKGHPIDPTFLAYLLRGYGIKPKTIRLGTETMKGYERADFLDAWGSYLPHLLDLPQEASQPSQASQPGVAFDFSLPSPAANDNYVPLPDGKIEITDRDGRKRLIRPF